MNRYIQKKEVCYCIICIIAPFALFFPWVIIPSHLFGYSSGGLHFFISWLIKYPNFGPFNYEVMLGIICILGTAILPFLFGFYYLRGFKKKYFLFFIFFLYLLALIPTIIYLDWIIWLSVFMPNNIETLNQNIVFIMGPLLHTLPLPFMVLLLTK